MYIVVHTHRGILSELEYRSRREMGGRDFICHTSRHSAKNTETVNNNDSKRDREIDDFKNVLRKWRFQAYIFFCFR